MTVHLRHAAVALILLLAACDVETAEPATSTSTTPTPAPAPTEPDVRRQIDQETWQAFASRDFATLERTAATFRDPAQRTPSGLWKLSSFYVAAANYLRSIGPCIGDPAPAEALFALWDRAVPDSPTLPLVRASHHLCMAYPPNGKLDADALKAVRADLDTRDALADTDPYVGELRLWAAALEGLTDADYAAAMQDATHRQPGFHETWFRAVDMATWQDDADNEIEVIARAAAGLAPSEGLYARIYWYAASKHYGDALFEQSRADWTMMRMDIDTILGKYPDTWNVNHFARFACLAGDRETTRRLMRWVVSKPVVRQAWPSQEVFEACRDGRFGDAPTPTPTPSVR